jgi:hypothetical protein
VKENSYEEVATANNAKLVVIGKEYKANTGFIDKLFHINRLYFSRNQ